MTVQPAPYQGTRITEPPMWTGRGGDAWRVRLSPLGQRATPDYDATVGIYLVRSPGAHPLWDHYAFTVIHLRPIAGVKPAHLRFDGATHEFMIMALNPERPLPALDVGPNWHVSWLSPIDVVEQFGAADDAVADHILELAVRAIVDGLASPDQDWRAWWKQAIATTAQHYGDGTHQIRGRA